MDAILARACCLLEPLVRTLVLCEGLSEPELRASFTTREWLGGLANFAQRPLGGHWPGPPRSECRGQDFCGGFWGASAGESIARFTVVLATCNAVSQICAGENVCWGNEWRLDLAWADDFRLLIRAQGWKTLLKVTWFSVYLVCSCRLD